MTVKTFLTFPLVIVLALPAFAGNVVLFVGDGMGLSTITAARIHQGQKRGKAGEENRLFFETLPHIALVRTYNTDRQVADSAGTITALLSGVRTRAGVVGVGPQVPRGNCPAGLAHPVPTLLEIAEDSGKATGIVTTSRITHATPAGAYAHSAERNWEHMVPAEFQGQCRDIALQFSNFPAGDGIDVVLGGGRQHFLPEQATDPEYEGAHGKRRDGRNLIDEWLKSSERRRFVWRTQDIAALEAERPGVQILGLFEPGHMQYEVDRSRGPSGEPSLAAMTRFAIHRLVAEDKGFFLLVEGGRIDHAHHAGNAYRALEETIAMDNAVKVAVTLLQGTDSLILVTADHSHTLSIGGEPRRGNPILGLVRGTDGVLAKDLEGNHYTTLGYANGPGYRHGDAERNPHAPLDSEYLQDAIYPLPYETHGGEDVPAYALGSGSSSVAGAMDQHELFHVMRAVLEPQQ